MKWTRTRAAGALAVGAVSALLLSACSDDGPVAPTVSHEPVTITMNYYGTFGLIEDVTGPSLESVYEKEHPWVSLEMVSGEYADQHNALTKALIEGTGAPTIAAIDEGYLATFVAQQDSFVNLLELGAGDYEDSYLPWKWAEAANADGSVVIGLGFEAGGLAMCYRKDLFEAAGLDSDREAVSAALGGSWEDFIKVGQEYLAGSGGKKFVDNATYLLNPMLQQAGVSYYDTKDELDIEAIKPSFDTVLAITEAGLSAGLGQWTADWDAGFSNGDFAVVACPQWMLSHIKSTVGDDFTGQWDIADIPGDGGSWGGSFYTIPKQGSTEAQQAAYDFIEWIIQPEQQVKIMEETGKLPSQVSILESDSVDSLTNEFFDDAPYGKIFAKTVLDLDESVYYAPKNNTIRKAVEDVLNGVQVGNIAIVDAWDTAMEAVLAADG